jgi:arylsulfatase A-like enzyme
MVCVDTLRADHVGAYGYHRDTTPVMDVLAEEGVLYEEVISTSNWTVPAVASILTSLPPGIHGAGVPGELKSLGRDSPPMAVRQDVVTLADVLAEKGFSTGLFSANPYLYGRFKRSFSASRVGRESAEDLVSAAIGWLEKQIGSRIFLYIQLMDLHQPNDPPEPFFSYFETPQAGSRGDEHKDWAFGRQVDMSETSFQSFRSHRLALYDGSLRYADQEIGRLLQEFEDRSLLDETLVLLTSDHGEEFWDHAEEGRRWGDDPRGIWGIGHGHTMFQELLHVPLIIRGPGFRGGARVSCPASLLDLAPTALVALGVAVPEGMVGVDLRELHAPPPGETSCASRAVAASSPAYGPDSGAVILDGWKLSWRGDRVALFDLLTDPEERQDLAGSRPDLLARLLGEKPESRHDQGSSEAMEISPELEDELRALGYIP